MNCNEIKNIILESFGEKEISAELKEHLDSCPECNAYYHELNALSGFTGSDDDFILTTEEVDQMVEEIDIKISRMEPKTKTTSIWRYYVPVAAAVVLIFGITWMGGFFSSADNSAGTTIVDSMWVAINDADISNDVTGDELNFLINDYSSGVTTIQADQVVDELTEAEYEYLARNFDVGDIL